MILENLEEIECNRGCVRVAYMIGNFNGIEQL